MSETKRDLQPEDLPLTDWNAVDVDEFPETQAVPEGAGQVDDDDLDE